MKVECPACGKANRIGGKPSCGECGSSFSDTIFKKKPIVTAFSVAVFTGVGLAALDRHLLDDAERYPLAYEYQLVEFCSSGRLPVYVSDAKHRLELCLCAVNGVEDDLDFDSFKSNQRAIKPILEARLKACDTGAT